jgi:hypothetical protein
MKELLPYYIALQPFFKEKLGEIKAGETVYHKCTIFGEELDSKIWPEADRIEIVRIERASSVSGYYHCVSNSGESRFLTSIELLEKTCIRIPTLEQLWGMVDWMNWECFTQMSGMLTISKGEISITGEPVEAILNALCEQEGVNI